MQSGGSERLRLKLNEAITKLFKCNILCPGMDEIIIATVTYNFLKY